MRVLIMGCYYLDDTSEYHNNLGNHPAHHFPRFSKLVNHVQTSLIRFQQLSEIIVSTFYRLSEERWMN